MPRARSSEDSEYYGKCVLANDCRGKTCKNDTYFLPGYIEDFRKFQFFSMDFDANNRRKFHCYLPFNECGYDIRCILDNLDREIQTHSKKQKIDLLGLSFGGMLAQAYSAEHPDKVDKMVLIQSFSSIHDWLYDIKRLENPKHLRNMKEYDINALKKAHPREVFIHNCFMDLFMGDIPNYNGSEGFNEPFCLHGTVSSKAKGAIKRFMEKKP